MYSLEKLKDINVGDFLANKGMLLYLGILMLMFPFSFALFLLFHDLILKFVRLSHRIFVKAKKVFRGAAYAMAIIGMVFILLSFSRDVY